MNKSLVNILIASVVLAFTVGGLRAAETKVEKEILDDRASDINAKAKKPGLTEVALHGISVETGVPRDQVEAMYKHHKTPAGILIACVLSDETKRPPQDFLEKRASGKSWTAIARDHHVPLEKINNRLAHLERELANGGERKH